MSSNLRSGRQQACVLFVGVLLGLTRPAYADVRIHGATTVAFGLMKPQQARIEQHAEAKLLILPSSTTHGLADLAQGKADITMLAEPLDTAADATNEKTPSLVNLADYVSQHVGDAFVEFIVHPSNPLGKLTKAQVAALYAGQIKNWAELGAQNIPVMIVVEPASSPYRVIRDALGISYTRDARVIQNTNQAAIIAAQAPGTLGNISTAHEVPERGRFKVIATDLKLRLPLHLVYRKDAPDVVKRVVAAAVEVSKL